MIKEAIVKIVSKEDLTYEEAYTVNGYTERCISGCSLHEERPGGDDG